MHSTPASKHHFNQGRKQAAIRTIVIPEYSLSLVNPCNVNRSLREHNAELMKLVYSVEVILQKLHVMYIRNGIPDLISKDLGKS